jgi:NAD(P)-dependent dehydrogenase (short-subunit alcohol dehydrogenase family)
MTMKGEPSIWEHTVLDPSVVTLSGKVAIVTGAARGLGRAIALTFARFGADLALCDRQSDELAAVAAEAEALGRTVTTAVIDVRG